MANQGAVKLFNPMKGFGFITAADGSDIFLHIKACVDGGVPQQGDQVAFDLEPSQIKPGQMQAGNVTGGTGVAGAKGGGKGGGGANQGAVKSFNAEKGFGFIYGSNGAEDLFFHIKGVVDGSTPQAGDMLSFDLEPSRLKPGQMQAQNITGGSGWGDSSKGGGKGGYGAAKGGGGDSWGPYGGGKDGGKSGGKGGKMEAMMSMMSSMWGGNQGGDSWGGKGGDSWGGKGGDSWGGNGGW